MRIALFLFFVFLISSTPLFAKTVSLSRQMHNQTAFTKLYGYVRYFHPSDEAREIDWDKLAVYGSAQVINANNDTELIKILNKLFTPVAPTLKLYQDKSDNGFDFNVLIPPEPADNKHTCWQYKGLNNHPPQQARAPYHSVRTNHDFRIAKDSTNTQTGAYLSVNFLNLPANPAEVRISYSIRKSVPDTVNSIYLNCNHDEREDSVLTTNWEHKSYTFASPDYYSPILFLYFDTTIPVLLDSLVCEVKLGNEWKQYLADDFSSYTPGNVPTSFNVNCMNEYNGWSPNADVLVQNVDGNNVLYIQKSETDLPYTMGFFTKLFNEEAAWNQLIDEPLVRGISCQLPLSLYNKLEQTYPPADAAKLSALQKNLESIDLHERTSQAQRLAALTIYWNQLQHFFPYWQYAGTDWAKEYQKALKQTLKCNNLREFVLIMSELASQTHDSHATFFDDTATRAMPDFYAEPFGRKWIVTKVSNDSLAIPVGSQVIEFAGKPFKPFIDKYRKYNVSATQQHSDKYLFIRCLRSYQDSSATFTFRTPDRQIITKEVPFRVHYAGEWFNREGKATRFSDGVYYVNLGQKGVNRAELDSLLTELTAAKGIVFDLRDYPQRTDVINYLLTVPDTTHCHFVKCSIQPDCNFLPDREFMFDRWGLQPQEPHITAKAVFLCSGYSVSYCESVLMEIKYNKLGTIIGQPTAGSTGDVVQSIYPGDVGAWWTGMYIYNPDGTRFHGVGIIPDIIVPRTIDAVAEGKDEELDVALRHLQTELGLKAMPTEVK